MKVPGRLKLFKAKFEALGRSNALQAPVFFAFPREQRAERARFGSDILICMVVQSIRDTSRSAGFTSHIMSIGRFLRLQRKFGSFLYFWSGASFHLCTLPGVMFVWLRAAPG